jgi:acyl carrier protein
VEIIAELRQEDVLMPTKDEIFKGVQECLVEALGVDDEEVQADKTLTGDLGAESIDFLDIVFRLEKAFSIKIPRGELFPDDLLNNSEYVSDGKLTEEGVKVLRQKIPHADLARISETRNVDDIPKLFTVQMIVNYVATKVT